MVDDDATVAMVLAGLARQAGYTTDIASSGGGALERVRTGAVDVVLTDLRMPGMDGMELLRAIKQAAPDIPVIMLTAHASVEGAVEAMRAGASDFLLKPFKRDEVLFSLRKALQPSERLAEEPPRLGHGKSLVGSSPAMCELLAVLERAARSSANVLIRGESGTGKELAARSIHDRGARAEAPFIAVNCGALPDQLLESELFGYEKGAFTGAVQHKPGRVALAEGGTLLLDEIGDVSPTVQVKLLRLLQEKQYEPLGATATRAANVRFIAATHQDLEQLVERGDFREDLYYRLNVVPIWMPPLREHPSDIPPLAAAFAERLAHENGRPALTLGEDALGALVAHDWPGNVRELQNFVERLVVFCDHGTVTAADVRRELERSPRPRLAGPVSSRPTPVSPAEPTDTRGLADRRLDAERAAILEALERARGNRTQAARLLGISRRTLYKRLDALGLEGV